jgi:hypothetical protein
MLALQHGLPANLGNRYPGDDSAHQPSDGTTHGTSSAAIGPSDGKSNGDHSRANDNAHELQQQQQQQQGSATQSM